MTSPLCKCGKCNKEVQGLLWGYCFECLEKAKILVKFTPSDTHEIAKGDNMKRHNVLNEVVDRKDLHSSQESHESHSPLRNEREIIENAFLVDRSFSVSSTGEKDRITFYEGDTYKQFLEAEKTKSLIGETIIEWRHKNKDCKKIDYLPIFDLTKMIFKSLGLEKEER